MYTADQIKRSTFTETTLLRSVRYSHTDPALGDMWTIVCASCGGNGYDLETEPELVTVCTACDGLGESDDMPEHEVRAILQG
jgi:hypothetical protein